MIIKILFASALTLHWPWPFILISVLSHPGLFKVLGRSFFYTRGVFELDISLDNLSSSFACSSDDASTESPALHISSNETEDDGLSTILLGMGGCNYRYTS